MCLNIYSLACDPPRRQPCRASRSTLARVQTSKHFDQSPWLTFADSCQHVSGLSLFSAGNKPCCEPTCWRSVWGRKRRRKSFWKSWRKLEEAFPNTIFCRHLLDKFYHKKSIERRTHMFWHLLQNRHSAKKYRTLAFIHVVHIHAEAYRPVTCEIPFSTFETRSRFLPPYHVVRDRDRDFYLPIMWF